MTRTTRHLPFPPTAPVSLAITEYTAYAAYRTAPEHRGSTAEMPNEIATETGAYALPDDLTPGAIEALLAAAGNGWSLGHVLGLWTAERRGPGTVRRFVVARKARGLVTKILTADAEDFCWPIAGPVCPADCGHRSCQRIFAGRYTP